MNKNIENINESIKLELLKNFVRRMLIYYDPMDVISLGAPYDEYDGDIGKIVNLVLQKDVTVHDLASAIQDIYKAENSIQITRKAQRMAEDLLYLKGSGPWN